MATALCCDGGSFPWSGNSIGKYQLAQSPTRSITKVLLVDVYWRTVIFAVICSEFCFALVHGLFHLESVSKIEKDWIYRTRAYFRFQCILWHENCIMLNFDKIGNKTVPNLVELKFCIIKETFFCNQFVKPEITANNALFRHYSNISYTAWENSSPKKSDLVFLPTSSNGDKFWSINLLQLFS